MSIETVPAKSYIEAELTEHRMQTHSMARAAPIPAATMAVLAVALLVMSLPAFSQQVGAAGRSPFGAPVIKTRVVNRHEIVTADNGGLDTVIHTPASVLSVQNKLRSISAAQSSGAQVVTLDWRKHGTYEIPIRVGNFATLTLPAGSPIVQVAFTNPAALQVSVVPATNSIMVRLMQPISVPGTIITRDKNYFITLVPSDSLWYQGVYWREETSAASGGMPGMHGVYMNASAVASSAKPSGLEAGLGGQPNFNYTLRGDADFRPLAVWDNGRFTWIQFKRNVQELPAVFIKDRNGLSIVNYTVHDAGTEIMVNRLMPEFVLRVGREDVTVKARGAR